MKFSLNFLKQIVDVKLPVKEVARLLTAAGLEVEEVKKVGKDWIFDIEITTNRYDWLSIIGVAQEIAAVTGTKLKLEYPKIQNTPKLKEKDIFIEDSKDCPCYLAREIRNVTIKPSSVWLKNILLNSGLASVNNVVDITNYCMLKWGNPLHAFDLDKIEGSIYIRRAKKGEIFVGIDQKQRVLGFQNLVIADQKKIIALAGVMGAKNTEVTSRTKNIFLEAAIFSPVAVRRSRRFAGIDTESSYRFERKVSAFFLEYASQEAANLILKSAKGDFTGFIRMGKKSGEKPRGVSISLAKMESYLGVQLQVNQVKKILESLNLKVDIVSSDKIKVKPHFARFDIEKPVDVYEEFIRIYGYDKIEPKIPFLKKEGRREAVLDEKELFWKFKDKVRDFVSLLGFSEIVTYSLENRENLLLFSQEQALKLRNPLRSQEDSLRPTLSLGMVKAIRHNLNRGKEDLNFFEIADIYNKNKKSVLEKPFLSLGVSGGNSRFFLLKGAVLEIFDYFNIKSFKLKQSERKCFTNSLDITVDGKSLGFLGKLDKEVEGAFGLKQGVFIAALDVRLLKKYAKEKLFKPFSRFPAIWHDVSLALKKDVWFEDIKKIIEKESQYLSGMKIIDTYQSKELPKDYYAFTLRIFYQSKEKTLNSDEVDSYHNKIRDQLSAQPGVILR